MAEDTGRGGEAGEKKKRGRPPGSVSLGAELEARILGLISAGADYESACAACGVAERTHREWKARGERRRGPISPRLESFIKKCNERSEQAAALAQARLLQKSPAGYVRRSDQRKDKAVERDRQDGTGEEVSVERLEELARLLIAETIAKDPTLVVPPHPDGRDCPCPYHHEREGEEDEDSH